MIGLHRDAVKNNVEENPKGYYISDPIFIKTVKTGLL